MSFYNKTALCSFLGLINCFICYSSSHAEVTLPDTGTVLKQVESDLPKMIEKSDQTFFSMTSPATEYSDDPTLIKIQQVAFSGHQAVTESVLQELVKNIQGSEVTLADIQKAVNHITQYYRQQGYFLATAYLPRQTLTQGQLRIQNLEGKLGRVELNNQSRVRNRVIQDYIDQLPIQQALSLDESNRTLLLISDIYGVGQIQANMHAGQQLGETDLIIGLDQQKAWAGRIGVDNTGSRYTGQYRVSSYLETYSVLGYGEKMSFQLQKSNHDLTSTSFAAQVPVFGDGMLLGGGVSRTEYALGEQFKLLEASGTSENYQLNLFYPIVRRQTENLSLTSMLEQRKLMDKIAVTDTQTDKSTQVFRLTLDASRQDDWGVGVSKGGINKVAITTSIGQLDIDTPSSLLIDRLSAKTQGHFQKFELKLSRQQLLGFQWILDAELNAQFASKNLDSSEKFSVSKMRAYPSAEALGDQGWGASLNLYYQFHPVINFFIFQDLGQTEQNKKPFTDEENRRSLASTGIGVGGMYKRLDYNVSAA